MIKLILIKFIIIKAKKRKIIHYQKIKNANYQIMKLNIKSKILIIIIYHSRNNIIYIILLAFPIVVN